MRHVILFLFTIAAGLTASGIFASLYRMLAREPESRIATVIHYVVMSVAGPVVLLTNSTRSFRRNECSKAAYAVAIALGTYWSFATGLLILAVTMAIRGA